MLLATYLFDSDKELLDSLKSQLVTLDQDPTSSKQSQPLGNTGAKGKRSKTCLMGSVMNL